MEEFNFSINTKSREKLSKATRVYRIIYGAMIFILGIILVVRTGFSSELELSFLGEAMIVLGILSIIYGLVGNKVFMQTIQIDLNDGIFRVKKSFEREITIGLNRVSYMKILPFKLEFSFVDYTKTYDFSYLTKDELESVSIKLSEYCSNHKIEIGE
jgi:hypothetical protein